IHSPQSLGCQIKMRAQAKLLDPAWVLEFVIEFGEKWNREVLREVLPPERIFRAGPEPQRPASEQTIKDRLDQRRPEKLFAFLSFKCHTKSLAEVVGKPFDGLGELRWQLGLCSLRLAGEDFCQRFRLRNRRIAGDSLRANIAETLLVHSITE